MAAEESQLSSGSTRSSHSNAYFYGKQEIWRWLADLCVKSGGRIWKQQACCAKKPVDGENEPGKSKESRSSGCKIEEIVAILGEDCLPSLSPYHVAGHELGHWAKAHIYKQVIAPMPTACNASHMTCLQLIVAELHLLIFFYMFGYMLHNQGPHTFCRIAELITLISGMYAAFGFQSKKPVIIGLILFSNIGFLLLSFPLD
eukprot:653331-Hanusia_phi.AAC.2